jgi:initiation factor 1A
MPRNTQGGNRAKSKPNHPKVDAAKGGMADTLYERPAGTMVGRAIRMLGNSFVQVYCNDGRLRRCRICGVMRKRRGQNNISVDDLVLVSVRDFTADPGRTDTVSETADIVGVYTSEQRRTLKRLGELNPHLFSATADTRTAVAGGAADVGDGWDFDGEAADVEGVEEGSDDGEGEGEGLAPIPEADEELDIDAI